jgi:hypothetical protein
MFFNKDESVLEINPPDQAIPIDLTGETHENWITGLPPPGIIKNTSKTTPMNITSKITSDMSRLENTTKLLMDEHDIPDLFSQSTLIETASDGGFNPTTGISSFGWVVAVNKTLIAIGRLWRLTRTWQSPFELRGTD